jgi:hypothetical protein
MYNHQGYNYVGIPAFTDYAHIKAHYEGIAPIRGRTEEIRPIGRRRYDWYEIAENRIAVDISPENPLGTFAKSYACRLYRTDCVEWFPNGDIVIRIPRWKGPTAMGMITYSLAQYGTVISFSGKWYFRNKANEDFLLPEGKGEELLMRKAEDKFYRPVNLTQEYKYKAKRKRLNEVRRCYQDFIEYARTMLAMDATIDINRELIKELGFAHTHLTSQGWQDTAKNRSHLLQKIIQAQANNDLDLMFKLAQYCSYSFGRYYYTGVHTCPPEFFVRGFNEVLKYVYHNEVFEAVEVEKGKAFHDRNAKYWK